MNEITELEQGVYKHDTILLKVELLDHLIMGRATQERPRDYCSLRELGYFSGF